MAIPEKRFWLFDVEYDSTDPDTIGYEPLEFGPWKTSSIDITGKINPTDYTPHKEEDPVRSKIAINGYRQSAMVPKAPETRVLKWDRIEKFFYDELKVRYDSGHIFILLDHNKQYLVGRIKDFEFDEIVSTVPSAYTGGFEFEGIGNWRSSL